NAKPTEAWKSPWDDDQETPQFAPSDVAALRNIKLAGSKLNLNSKPGEKTVGAPTPMNSPTNPNVPQTVVAPVVKPSLSNVSVVVAEAQSVPKDTPPQQPVELVKPAASQAVIPPANVPPPTTQIKGPTTLSLESVLTAAELLNDENDDIESREDLHQQFENLKRRKTSGMSIKAVPIVNGNFVVEVPISKHCLDGGRFDGSGENGQEFTHLKYTAITCDPDQFAERGYSLRASDFSRKIKIAVVITMYNEDDILFCKTYRAVVKNISYICGTNQNWTSESWKEIAVVIVSDGRQKINPTVLTVMGVIGLYLDGLEKSSVNGTAVQAHMFEYTTQNSVDQFLNIRNVDDTKEDLDLVPCQTIVLIKEKNAKKINSHRWFFNAICKVLNPEVCFLIDVGTKPTKESFFHLYNAFLYDDKVGGACGEIAVEIGKYGRKLLNPLVAAQNFEYKMSNILDKPLESVLGYISVLPGAFSAYRYEALLGKPLEMYFKGETPHGENVSEANMYLAEDRILCFELAVKKDKSWLLKYVKSASAQTDVPTELHDLISQRRRWLNGSFFVAVHSTYHWYRVIQSSHTFFRKCAMLFEFFYNACNLWFNWFAMGNFYLAFFFLFDISNSSDCGVGTPEQQGVDPFYPRGQIVFNIFNEMYLSALIAIFVASLGNRPAGSKILYLLIACTFSFLMFMMMFMAIWSIKASVDNYQVYQATNGTNQTGLQTFVDYAGRTPSFRDIFISMGTTYGVYLIASGLHMEPWHCFSSMVQYLLILPTFVNVFMIYSFCNIHDVTWGTKGDNTGPTAGAVTIEKGPDGKDIALVELPAEPADTDSKWVEMKKQLDHNAMTMWRREEKTV
ncbi:Chitin synthase, class 2, partial [Blyttiomyces sp. JEL0837]